MVWLYRLQQRLSITRREGLAVLTLTVLFVTGLTVRHVQEQQIPPVEVDSLVARSSPPDSSERSLVDPDVPSPDDPIDLNRASRDALEALDGIGPALSERIVQYRTAQRPFQRVRELQRVRGIGPKTMAELRPLVTVSAESE
jgi:competence protein ComEA